jgi:hypothetical protein
MRSFVSGIRLASAFGLVGLAAVAASACSAKAGEHTPPASSASSTSAASSTAEAASPQVIEVSPGGVTTKVDVPAESTEEGYSHACHAAKEWMASRGGDPHAHIEPFLQQLQSTTDVGPATFNSTWAQLSMPQQAAVIVAVQAAADGGC